MPFLPHQGAKKNRRLLNLGTQRFHRTPASRPPFMLRLQLNIDQLIKIYIANTEFFIIHTNCGQFNVNPLRRHQCEWMYSDRYAHPGFLFEVHPIDDALQQ